MNRREMLKLRLCEEVSALCSLLGSSGPSFSEAAAKCHATIDELNALDSPLLDIEKGETK